MNPPLHFLASHCFQNKHGAVYPSASPAELALPAYVAVAKASDTAEEFVPGQEALAGAGRGAWRAGHTLLAKPTVWLRLHWLALFTQEGAPGPAAALHPSRRPPPASALHPLGLLTISRTPPAWGHPRPCTSCSLPASLLPLHISAWSAFSQSLTRSECHMLLFIVLTLAVLHLSE